uniref:Uncharacterized protein n=1 Tax=Geospiza parvula TaxID=87175 RepID=A0A8C3MHR2_GEOPR
MSLFLKDFVLQHWVLQDSRPSLSQMNRLRSTCMVLWVQVGAWTYHYSDQGDYTWEQARNFCQTFFTDLVAIQNQQEIEYLNKSLPFHGRYYWIGLRKLGGIWTWVGTGKALSKEAENWALGEPNNRRSNQDCVEIYIQRPQQAGKWNDEPCNRKKKALCYRGEWGDCGPELDWVGWGPWQGAIACPVLSAPDQGEMHCSHLHGNFTYGSMCAFSCQTGFALVGLQSRECTATGTWTGDTPHCLWFTLESVTCPVLRAPEKGELNCSHLHGDFTFGSTCAFSCQKGFVLKGPESRECTATGTWTGDATRFSQIKQFSLVVPRLLLELFLCPCSNCLSSAQSSRKRRDALLPPPWQLHLWIHVCLLLPEGVCAEGAGEP